MWLPDRYHLLEQSNNPTACHTNGVAEGWVVNLVKVKFSTGPPIFGVRNTEVGRGYGKNVSVPYRTYMSMLPYEYDESSR